MRAFLLMLALLFATEPARAAEAAWQVARSQHFVVYSQGGVDELRTLTGQLEQYDGVLRSFLFAQATAAAPSDSPPLTVFVVDDQADVARAMGVASETIFGFYSTAASGPFVVVPRKGEQGGGAYRLTPRAILFHEYAHHFMLANYAGLYSPWYVEGFAEFFGTTEFLPDGRVAIGKAPFYRLRTLSSDWDATLRRLLNPGNDGLSDWETEQLYARSWLLVHYLGMSGRRPGQLVAYLNARAAGTDEPTAFRTAFNASFSDIDHEIRAYYKEKTIHYVAIPAPISNPRIDIADLPASQSALMALWIRFRDVPSKIALPGVVGDIRQLAARYPNDAFAQTLLAQAEFAAGNLDPADQAAKAALAADPKADRALLVQGQVTEARQTDAAGAKAARILIARANRLAPNDALPLIAFYRSYADRKEPPTENAVQGLERAQELVPQDPETRILLAGTYIAAKRYPAAARLLKPVAYSPHDNPLRKQAQTMLAGLPIAQDDAPPAAKAEGAPPEAQSLPAKRP